MLFLSRNGDSLCWKQRFHRQEAADLDSRNGGSWNWFVLLSASKSFISLITNIFYIMPKISVFRHLTTMRRQISAVCVVRIAFLLILFTYRRGVIYHVPYWQTSANVLANDKRFVKPEQIIVVWFDNVECDELSMRNVININQSLDRICLDLLLPSCFLTALVRLPASVLPFHLAVARYAFD